MEEELNRMEEELNDKEKEVNMENNKIFKKHQVIYHMADIHITNTIERYEEYEKVFEKIYKLLEKEPREKIIIITGDLFDNKITFKSYALTFVSVLISNLVKYGEVILIDGNHNVNMTNENIESTISSMLTLLRKLNINGIDKIHYLNENKNNEIKLYIGDYTLDENILENMERELEIDKNIICKMHNEINNEIIKKIKITPILDVVNKKNKMEKNKKTIHDSKEEIINLSKNWSKMRLKIFKWN